MKQLLLLNFLFFFNVCNLKCQTVEVQYRAFNLELSSKNKHASKHKHLKKDNPNTIVITSKEELIKLTACIDNCIFDFENFIIIGINGSIGGCKIPTVSFKVLKDQNKKKYLVEATVFQSGNCRGFFAYSSFITIEKPNEDYKIEIKTTNAISQTKP